MSNIHYSHSIQQVIKLKYSHLQKKKVVDMKSGAILGHVQDLDIQHSSLCIESILVGKKQCGIFSILFNQPLTCIPVQQITNIGEDVILVNVR